jgi:hypothetical protein
MDLYEGKNFLGVNFFKAFRANLIFLGKETNKQFEEFSKDFYPQHNTAVIQEVQLVQIKFSLPLIKKFLSDFSKVLLVKKERKKF